LACRYPRCAARSRCMAAEGNHGAIGRVRAEGAQPSSRPTDAPRSHGAPTLKPARSKRLACGARPSPSRERTLTALPPCSTGPGDFDPGPSLAAPAWPGAIPKCPPPLARSHRSLTLPLKLKGFSEPSVLPGGLRGGPPSGDSAPTSPLSGFPSLCAVRQRGLRLHLHHVEWGGRSSSYETPGHFPSCASRL
jgi:hypothetical protein